MKKAVRLVALLSVLALVMTAVAGIHRGAERSHAAQGVSVKQRSTYYTPDKVAAARKNVQNYDWARKMRDYAVREADIYVKLGYDRLWSLIPSQEVPRSYLVDDRYGVAPYEGNPLKEPWKLTETATGRKFPTNDFAAYYKSGLDEHGVFRKALADERLLVNKLYPDKGEKWGVDDGTGWVDENGVRHMFVAYYTHLSLWEHVIFYGLINLRDAYLYTGDEKYANAGIVMLDRIADMYPEMDVSAFPEASGFRNVHGYTGQGKILGSILEADEITDIISCYDAFFPVMNDDNADYVAFLKDKSSKYDLGKLKTTADGIKKNIEDGLLRQIYPAILKAQIRGNFGSHHSALIMAAVVLDEPETSEQWIEFAFRTGGLEENGGKWSMTGGNIHSTLVDDVDRDGYGNESGAHYNWIWLKGIMRIADILNGYDRARQYDLRTSPKLAKMASALIDMTMIGSKTATIGDSGGGNDPELFLDKTMLTKAFQWFREPKLAQAALFANGNTATELHGDIFSADPEAVARDIQSVIRDSGTLQLGSDNLTGYGMAVLRAGETIVPDQDGATDRQRDVWLYYGRNNADHAHLDSLNIGLHAYGLDLMPDFGYPSRADVNDLRYKWERNTVSHNTVVVDESGQKRNSWSGLPVQFDDVGRVKWMEVEAPLVYPQTSEYKRTTAMIQVDEERSYAVDFFRVSGGTDHVYSLHAASGLASTEGLKLTAQTSGTYAGADVPYAAPEYNSSSSSGFNYLTSVVRDRQPADSFSVDWPIDNGVHLRLSMLGTYDDVALADGQPPQISPDLPDAYRFVLVHRQGSDLQSTFTSVLEPYKGERFIRSVKEAVVKKNGTIVPPNEARAIKVELKSGRIDYIVSSTSRWETYTVDDRFTFQGIFGVYSEEGGLPSYAYVGDGATLSPQKRPLIQGAREELQGTLVDFTKTPSADNYLTLSIPDVKAKEIDPTVLIGKYIYIDNDYRATDPSNAHNAVYRIVSASPKADGTLQIGVGNVTLMRKYADPADFGKGYVFDVAAGNKFRIPLSSERYGSTFRDVPPSHWAHDSVEALTSMGIVQGDTPRTFSPERPLSRAEFAALLVRTLGLQTQPTEGFADVTNGDWFAGEVGAAAAVGIVEGVSTDAFEPHTQVKREEMATMLVRSYFYKKGASPLRAAASRYRDMLQAEEWARPYIEKATELRLLEGQNSDTFEPKGQTTRAEGAKAAHNLYSAIN